MHWGSRQANIEHFVIASHEACQLVCHCTQHTVLLNLLRFVFLALRYTYLHMKVKYTAIERFMYFKQFGEITLIIILCIH